MISDNLPIAEIRQAATRPEVVEAMRRFYAELTEQIAQHQPACINRGDCCRFGEYGHRLYVTSLELAYYLATVGRQAAPEVDGAVQQQVCPHAQGGICTVRISRPMGCRVFYCDPAAQHWQGPLTETMLARLRRMHEELNVPYVYLDWLRALDALL